MFLVAASAAARTHPDAAARTSARRRAWSEARRRHYAQQGKPVFVYFTADWCLTCKVNEAAAIDRDEVRDAFSKAGVKVLAGDWTNGDPAITRFLEGRGRAGVPLYLWYAPGKPPEELPQVLTPSMLIGRAQAVAALGARLHTFLPPTQVSSTSVRASDCASTLVGSRSTRMKSAHLPDRARPSCLRQIPHKPRRA